METANTGTLEMINDLQNRTCDCLNCISQTTLKDIDLLIKKLTEVKEFCCSEHCKRSDQSHNKLVKEITTNRSHSRSRIPLAVTRLRRETNVNLPKRAPNSQLTGILRQHSCPLSSQSLILKKEYVAQHKYEENNEIFYRNKSLDRDCISKELSMRSVKFEINKEDDQLTTLAGESKVVEDKPNSDSTDLTSTHKNIPMQYTSQNHSCKTNSTFFKHESLKLGNKKICRCKNQEKKTSPVNTEKNPCKKKLEINLTCKDVPTDSITFEISQPVMKTYVIPDVKNVDNIPFTETYQKCLAEHRKELDNKINQINYLRREAQQNLKDKLGLGEDNSRAYRSW